MNRMSLEEANRIVAQVEREKAVNPWWATNFWLLYFYQIARLRIALEIAREHGADI
jgi:hypothetical protein